MTKNNKKEIILLLVIIAAMIPFIVYALSITPETSAGSKSKYPVYITEILASNNLYPDENGVCCDWIEIYNSSDADIDISNFGLSDNQVNIRYTFPEGTYIGAGEYLVVYCSDMHGEGYAPFKISKSGGEDIVFISESNVIIDRIETVETTENCPMILNDLGEWTVGQFATPGFVNSEEGRNEYAASLNFADTTLKITEIMPSNKSVVADCDGDFSDYIEISNVGENEANLKGFYLSDKSDEPLQMMLPDTVIEPGGSVVVFASGKNGVFENGEIHAPFSLSSDGECVVLTSPAGVLLDSFSYERADDDRSIMIDAEGNTVITAEASPGYSNDGVGYEAFCSSRIAPDDIVINEVMTSNASLLAQSDGEYYDWIELRNNSSGTVNLSDYYLTDSSEIKDKFRLPDISLAPGQYQIIICSGMSEKTNGRYVHANFSLSADEDSLFLYNKDADIVDYCHLIDLTYEGSYGRMQDGSSGYFYFKKPSPGAENSGGKRTVEKTPFSSVESGVYNDRESLTVELLGGNEIRYTTDGTIPTGKSKLYSEPIVLNKTTVIRAACFSKEALTGKTATFSYFLNEGHTLPIVSLAVAPEDLWSAEKGIYVEGNHNNYYQDWEKLANVSLFEDDGSFTIDCGLKMHGAGTRKTSAKKSFKVVFRPRYGGTLDYKVFDDSEISEFHSLLIRGGEDYTKTIFRDELSCSLAEQGSNNLLTLNDKHCVLYINGEYFGIFSIREAYSEEYCSSHLDVSPNSVTIARAPVRENVNPSLYKLISFARTNDMKKDENYRYIDSKINLDSLIDWYIFEAYCGNNDIPGNVRYVYSSEEGKWRYCLFDMDWAFVWFGTCRWAFDSNCQHSALFRALIKNDEFKDRFLTRMAELFDSTLSDENILKTIDYYTELLRPEMKREKAYWGGSVKDWEKHVRRVRAYITDHDRIGEVLRSMKSYMNLTDKDIAKYFGR
ncbi:MAG: hypothetical protein E7546_02880 [Ruminococcaceae bacterium]|nr:hypothetical protein [Oscillospiraceae bacterium]